MRYLLLLAEQAMASLLNIGINIWLIRVGGSDLFGVYAFWFNVALVVGSVQYGLTICHLAPLPPGPGTMAQRVVPERALLAVSLVLVLAAAAAVAVAVAIDGGRSSIGSSAAIAMVPAYLVFQYARALAFSRGALVTATAATTASVALFVAGLAVAHGMRAETTATDVLLIAALAYGIAGGVTTLILASGLQLRLSHLRHYRAYASISRWSLLGIVCFELINRLPGFAVTGGLGAAALGRMSSTQMVSRPPTLVVAALMPALRNQLAGLRQQGAWRRFGSLTWRCCGVVMLGGALWAVPVVLGWPLLSQYAFHGRFGGDVGLGLLWTASQALGSVAGVIGLSFQVCGAFRRIGIADLAGALATVLGLAVLISPFGIAGAIGAMIVGQLCYFGVVIAQWARLPAEFAQVAHGVEA